MNAIKCFCFVGIFLFILTEPAHANRFCRWFCERYHDPAYDADGLFHGYEDLYSYPFGYELPTNRYFNYCPPCPYYFSSGSPFRTQYSPYTNGGYARRR